MYYKEMEGKNTNGLLKWLENVEKITESVHLTGKQREQKLGGRTW